MTFAPNQKAVAQQQMPASAGPGPYTATAYVKLNSGGSVSFLVSLRWLDGAGVILQSYDAPGTPGSSYSQLTVSAQAAPPMTAAVSLRIEASGGPASVCVDDASLEGPALVPPTLTPTLTITPAPTETPTRTPTTAPATKTPRPPTATREPSATKPPTTPAGTSTAPRTKAGASSSSSVISDSLVNGGFEAGLAPWQKFGGELGLVASPSHTGAGAGMLTSATASTKWAYQVLSVQPGATYEFDGYLWPGGGIAEAYLRVSWYQSADGSGAAIGNTDSTGRLSGGAGDYAYLTTGSVAAPDAAQSARARVMLAPQSAASSTLYMDDLGFGPSDAPSRQDAVAAASAADDGMPPSSDPAAAPAAPAAAIGGAQGFPERADAGPSPIAGGTDVTGSVAEVAPALADRKGGASAPQRSRSSVVYLLLGLGAAAAAGFIVAAWSGRRRPAGLPPPQP